MSDNTLKWRDPPFSASDHVRRGDDLATANELIERLGQGAVTCAIGRRVEAQAMCDRQAAHFWTCVRAAVAQLESRRARASEENHHVTRNITC